MIEFSKGIAAELSWADLLKCDQGKDADVDAFHSVILDMDRFPPIEVSRRDRVACYYYLLQNYLFHLRVIRTSVTKDPSYSLNEMEWKYLSQIVRVMGLLDELIQVTCIVERVLPVKTMDIVVGSGKTKKVFHRAYKCFSNFANLFIPFLKSIPEPSKIAKFIDSWFLLYNKDFNASYCTTIGLACFYERYSCTNYLDELDDARLQPIYHKSRTRSFWADPPTSEEMVAFTNKNKMKGPSCPQCKSETAIYCTKPDGIRYWKCTVCDTKGKIARSRTSA